MSEKNRIVLEQETIKSIFEKHGEEGLNELIATMSSEILEKVYGFLEDTDYKVMHMNFFPIRVSGELGKRLCQIEISRNCITPLYDIYEKMSVDNILYDYYLNLIKEAVGMYINICLNDAETFKTLCVFDEYFNTKFKCYSYMGEPEINCPYIPEGTIK